MMSKRGKRLYGRMQHGLEKKKAVVEVLHKRRQELELCKGKNKTEEGDTMSKAKVLRLRSERRGIEKEYEKTASTGSMKKRKRVKKT